MSVINHEDITYELTTKERALIPYVVDILKDKLGRDKAIKGPELRQIVKNKSYLLTGRYLDLSSVRLRKIIHYLRVTGEAGILCSGRLGYWIADNVIDATQMSKSLKQRSNSISEAAAGLDKLINQKYGRV